MYYDRFKEATTSLELGKHKEKHIVLCHNNAENFTCISKYGQLIETGKPKGIQNNFNYALDSIKDGEWAIFMSDDYVCSKKYENGDFVLSDISYVLNELRKTIALADKAGVKLVGLNSTGNALYAKNKYGKFGLVDGRTYAIKKTNFKFHPDICTATDYYATVYHLKKYGGNLVNNHVFMEYRRYSEKGIGTIEQRATQKIKDVKLLKQLFPENIQIKAKAGQPANSHCVIKR
jgi:hypothetical protein